MDYVVRKLEVTDDKQHPGLAAVSKWTVLSTINLRVYVLLSESK